MNRDELLTNLAMELEEWPQPGSGSGLMRLPGRCWWGSGARTARWLAWPVRDSEGRGAAIDEHDWQARRTQLINKPSWDDAPEWAEWLAQDGRGAWRWYRHQPEATGVKWDSMYGPLPGYQKGAIPAGHNWRDTLEQRPADKYNESRADAIGQNGATGEHYSAMKDCLRCGGSYDEGMHDECPCGPFIYQPKGCDMMEIDVRLPGDPSSVSDGSTASYYELPEDCSELQELISHRNMNAQDGEIFRAIYRKGMASHSDAMRDAKKVLFYAKAEVERLEKLEG